MNKRGLSTVITTLILIAVSMVAIVGVGIFIKNFSQEKSEFITAEGLTLDVQISNVEILSDTQMKVQVKRNPGGKDISGVVFVVYDINNSEVHKKNIPLEELEKRNFDIILEVLNTSYVHKITVAPIFETSSGKEIVGTNEAERIINPRSGGGGSSSGGSSTPDPEPCPDGTCGAGETCSNCPADCGVCSTEECDLTNAIWTPTLVSEGDLVLINLTGENCNGEVIQFEIFEKDMVGGDDLVLAEPLVIMFDENTMCNQCIGEADYHWCSLENICRPVMPGIPLPCGSPGNTVSSTGGTCPIDQPITNSFSLIWRAVYEEDPGLFENDDSEYYFNASVRGTSESIVSPNIGINDPGLLVVEEPAPITCGNGICERGFGGENCETCLTDCFPCFCVDDDNHLSYSQDYSFNQYYVNSESYGYIPSRGESDYLNDFCVNSTHLAESYCDAEMHMEGYNLYEYYECPYGCDMGNNVCIYKTPCELCVEDDPSNYWCVNNDGASYCHYDDIGGPLCGDSMITRDIPTRDCVKHYRLPEWPSRLNEETSFSNGVTPLRDPQGDYCYPPESSFYGVCSSSMGTLIHFSRLSMSPSWNFATYSSSYGGGTSFGGSSGGNNEPLKIAWSSYGWEGNILFEGDSSITLDLDGDLITIYFPRIPVCSEATHPNLDLTNPVCWRRSDLKEPYGGGPEGFEECPLGWFIEQINGCVNYEGAHYLYVANDGSTYWDWNLTYLARAAP